MNPLAIFREFGAFTVMGSALWLAAVSVVGYLCTKKKMKSQPYDRLLSLLTLVSIPGPLFWSTEQMWVIGLPMVFLLFTFGLAMMVPYQIPNGERMGSGLLVGVFLAMLCRFLMVAASGK